jgi:hypothetical protein
MIQFSNVPIEIILLFNSIQQFAFIFVPNYFYDMFLFQCRIPHNQNICAYPNF